MVCTLILCTNGLLPVGSKDYVFMTFIASVQLTMGDATSYFGLVDNSLMRKYALYGYYIFSTGIITILALNLLITILGDGYAVLTSKKKKYD